MEVHRGEVFYADLSPVVGSEQGGVRPVLIVQNEIGNRHSPTVIAAAITSRLDKTRLPTHINIRAADTGLAKDSVVLLEQIRTLDKHRLRERAGQITPDGSAHLDNGTLAGSTLNINKGLRILVEEAMVPFNYALNACTINPARCLHLDDRKGSIQIGKDADLVVLDDNYDVLQTYCMGKAQL